MTFGRFGGRFARSVPPEPVISRVRVGADGSAGGRLAQVPEEGADVAGQEAGDLHGGEVAAPVVLGPVTDLAGRVHEAPDRGVGREHRDARRRAWPLAGERT